MTGTYRTDDRAQRPRLSAGVKALLAAISLLIAVGVIVSAARMTGISRNASRISALTQQIAVERSRCQQLEIALSERGNIDMIRDAARYSLGMVDPAQTDVRVVSLPIAPGEADVVTVQKTGE